MNSIQKKETQVNLISDANYFPGNIPLGQGFIQVVFLGWRGGGCHGVQLACTSYYITTLIT